jgi:hypothetical protein
VLGGLFLLPPFVAWWLAPLLGIDGGVRLLLAFSFPLVLMVGYQLWWIRILAAATGAFSSRIRRALGNAAGREHSNQEGPRLRPSAEEVQQLRLRELEVSSVFRPVARASALVVGVAIGFAVGWWVGLLAILVLMLWGQWLAALGAQGWLPIPEADD